jgi:hypothetical protein
VKRHEVPFVKKVVIKAAGELLSRPAAYRCRHRCRRRRARAPPALRVQRGSTSGGDIATCRIRLSRHFTRGTRQIAEESYEQPRRHPGLDSGEFASLDRPLPFVPLFDDLRAASLLAAFKWHLERMGWRVPRAGGLGRSLDACPREDCKGQGYILGRPRARGHS